MKSKIKTYIALVAIVAFSAISFAEDTSLNIGSSVDKDTFNIGDEIILNVVAENVSDYEIKFPEKLENTLDFVFKGARPIPSKWNDHGAEGYRYILTIYETGTHVIPQVPVEYRMPDEDEWQIKESPQISVEIISLLTEESEGIRDIKGPLPFGTILPRIILIIALLVIALVVFLMWKRRRRLPEKEIPAAIVPAHVIAYNELAKLKARNLPEKGLVKEYYTRLSGILRRYLENRFTIKAAEMTTEEFMETAKVSPVLNTEQKASLEQFLSHSDMVKFAKYGPSKLEMLDSFKLAEKFVQETALHKEKEVAE